MHTFKKLKDSQIHLSAILRENKKLVKEQNKCAYCESPDSLLWEHIIPKSRGGPDTVDNLVQSVQNVIKQKVTRILLSGMDWKESTRRHV